MCTRKAPSRSVSVPALRRSDAQKDHPGAEDQSGKGNVLRLCIVGSINVDCTSGEINPMTNAFIQMSGVFAELELRIIRERVRSGMQNARSKGRKIGRPQMTADDIPAAFLRHYPAYQSGRLNISELARVCGLSRTTVYKYIKLL